MKANRLGVVVLASSLFLSSCGRGGSTTSVVSADPNLSPPQQVQLHLSGLEETILQARDQKADQSLTFALTGMSFTKEGKQKAATVLFTRTVSAEGVIEQYTADSRRRKADATDGAASDAVTLSIPSGVTTLNAQVVGDQPGSVASEQIALNADAAGTTTLFVDVEMLPSDLAEQAGGSPLNISLYTPIETVYEASPVSTLEKGRKYQKAQETATPNEKFIYIVLRGVGIGRFRFDEGGRFVWVETMPVKGEITALAVDPLGESLSGFIAPPDEGCLPGNRCKHRHLRREACHHLLGKGMCGQNYYYHIYNLPSPPNDYHWPRYYVDRKIGINVRVDVTSSSWQGNGYGEWNTYVDNALSDWSKSSVLSLNRVSDYVDGRFCVKGGDPTPEGMIDVCASSYSWFRTYTDWLNNKPVQPACGATTGVWLGCGGVKTYKEKERHILSGFAVVDSYQYFRDIIISDDDYDVARDKAWARFILCQEIGHALGLSLKVNPWDTNHRDENKLNRNLGTCMDYTGQPAGGLGYVHGRVFDFGPSNGQPDAEDYRQLQTLHTHEDVVLTRRKAFKHGKNRSLSSFLKYQRRSNAEQSPRARLISVNQDGKLRVYRQDFGQGREITYYATLT